jgi:hypothetical protein
MRMKHDALFSQSDAFSFWALSFANVAQAMFIRLVQIMEDKVRTCIK